MAAPFNDWYHRTGSTYGTWLRGDPRDYRERHHRIHIDGDYKNPPPTGAYEAVLRRSQSLMKRPPVRLNAIQRRVAVAAMVEKFLADGIDVAIAAIDSHHFHILARFRDRRPRHWIGRAKMHSSMLLREHGIIGGAWATRSRPEPIRDRAHQVNTYRYIERHGQRGAAMWNHRDPPPPPTPRNPNSR